MAGEPSRLLPQCRSKLYRDPAGLFVHDLILEACDRFGEKVAIVDASCDPPRRISYAEYGDLVQRLAAGLSSRFHPGERIAIFLYNCWEFSAAYHAATLAGCIPTPLNPSYRDREVHHHLADSGAVALITDGKLLADVNVSDLPKLRGVHTIRQSSSGCEQFSSLVQARSCAPELGSPQETLAALPYSSGTTGLPKGVMLSHSALVTNVFQTLAPGEEASYVPDDVTLCSLPLYHIYGLNVVLNPVLAVGGTLVLMPRYDEHRFLELIVSEAATFLPLVPPLLNCLCQSALEGRFPRDHRLRYVKSGAAPLAGELARSFTELTGVRVRQGYGMTEASPVTHLGYIEAELYLPDSIGRAVAQTDCRLEGGADTCIGELVMRGPQFMLGYWNAPEATSAALRDGWYWSGDVATVDDQGFYRIVDRVKEMIKYKGFAIAPAELEAVLLEHPVVRDCGVVGRKDSAAGEIPCAFVVLRDGNPSSTKIADELCGYVGDRLAGYKQPRQVVFVESIPRNPSGKILRRKLRDEL
jgi:acyl-CoA synthetase (AMP-forming)/AMP-acid ligase II